MRGIVRRILYMAVFYSGLVYVFRFFYRLFLRNPVKILYTHRIIDESDELFDLYRELGYMTIQEFEKKIAYLTRHYRIIPLSDCCRYLRTGRRPPNCIVLTFDDGYKCNYQRAFPVLEKYGVPASVFLSYDFVENSEIPWHDKILIAIGISRASAFSLTESGVEEFNLAATRERKEAYIKTVSFLKTLSDDEKERVVARLLRDLEVGEEAFRKNIMLNWDEIRRMQESGLITFGAHTLRHPLLTRVSSERAKKEILESKTSIEKRLGRPVETFSYTCGRYNAQLKDLVAAAGYQCALTTKKGGNTGREDPLELKRDGFTSGKLYMLGLRAAGFFEILNKLRIKPDDTRQSEEEMFGILSVAGEVSKWLS